MSETRIAKTAIELISDVNALDDSTAKTTLLEALAWAIPHERQTPTGTAAKWFQSHDGENVITIQSQPYGVWCPGRRKVNASKRKTGVELGGSIQDYKGLKVVHANDTHLVVSYDFGGPCWAVYAIAN